MKPRATCSAVCARSCSCSYTREIPEEVLVGILQGETAPDQTWMVHIITFLTELPPDWICGCLKEHGLVFEDIQRLNEQIPKDFRATDRRMEEIHDCFRYS